MTPPTIHASAVTVGGRGVLIRGASGGGKSSLVLQLLSADAAGNRLVADDRVVLAVREGRVTATAPAALAGLLEIRGQGILRVPHLTAAAIDLVVDIVPEANAPRMPTAEQRTTTLLGLALPRIFLARGAGDGGPRIRAALNWPVHENA
jgi:serine kinase of HPr protein (carbohydrate metabolism regulator)